MDSIYLMIHRQSINGSQTMMNLRNSIALIQRSRFGCSTTARFRWGQSASKYFDRAFISSYGANNFALHHSRHSGVFNPSSSRDSLSSDAMPRLLILSTNEQSSLYRRHQIKSFQRRAIVSASPPPTKQFSPKNKRENNTIKINDVIIIGGGPTGLFLSNLLTSYQISSHLLFDKRPVSDLLKHPQAHFMNVRSMEILKAEVPRVYNGIVDEMPNVEEWEGFNFGGSVLSSSRFSSSASSFSGVSGGGLRGGRRMGRVIHPVREPLRVGQSGDAILVPHNETIIESNLNAKHDNADIVSTCRPAHLAQNKFVSLLLDEARRRLDILHKDDANEGNGNLALDDSVSDEYLRYDEEVTHISESKDLPSQQPIITIETSKGKTYHTRYLVAADGVHSPTRKHYHIQMNGEASIQNLFNVHFRTNEALSKLLMNNSTTNPTSPKSLNECNGENHQAMLHFIYNSKFVGVFVCHDGSNGEWVLQIPFFPPFQTMDDFTEDKVRGMIWAGLGIHPTHDNIASANNSNDEYRFDILSLRPWTMSSLVAQKYVNDSNTVVLVGDAAHAFPPAGGFGMNTGLQDAHNLAWRLALLLKSEANGSSLTNAKSILGKYEQDRKPIASQNAALSVRNYQRTLRIARACYLDAQHPQLLIKLLDSPPINFLPLQSRREMFRKLVQVAMMPLRSLEASSTASQSLHAKHIESNVRAILESGGSLPLVFPSFELGFAYDEEKNNRNPNAAMDTAGYVPRVKVGHRLPHVVVEILDASKDQNECLTERDVASMKIHSEKGFSDCISLADISSQLRQKLPVVDPIFNLLPVFSENIDDGTNTPKLIKSIADEFEMNIVVTPVFPKRPRSKFEGVVLVDKNQKLYTLATKEALSDTADNSDDLIAIIMVRPDGHVACVSWIHEAYANDKTAYNYSDQIRGAIKDGLAHSIGHIKI